MEPKLDATTTKANAIEGKLSTLETRNALAIEELTTGMTKSLQSVISDVEAMQEKVDDVAANADLDAMLMKAASLA